MPDPDDLALVRALLAAHGIEPPADDLAAIAAAYPFLRARIESLYSVECGDTDPAPLIVAREEGGS
jgi:hypothetical protein